MTVIYASLVTKSDEIEWQKLDDWMNVDAPKIGLWDQTFETTKHCCWALKHIFTCIYSFRCTQHLNELSTNRQLSIQTGAYTFLWVHLQGCQPFIFLKMIFIYTNLFIETSCCFRVAHNSHFSRSFLKTHFLHLDPFPILAFNLHIYGPFWYVDGAGPVEGENKLAWNQTEWNSILVLHIMSAIFTKSMIFVQADDFE